MTKDDIMRMALEAGTPITPEMKPEDALAIAFALGAAAEREACAKLVDEEMADYRYGTPPNIALNNAAAAIRARGQE